ncbi:FAD dependent oxidoreductase, putative [marine gamma proteobacterium HTCC2148]|nr:FAD dependent oxidoreductase, putative [marine gamma proteobacterium HTCC2148]MBT3412376.1 NAD(P)/FAD-dependent oxidoreductase [Halieaceae bacterium]
MSNYDIAIIGAGHNGLACAAYLAKAGRKVLVLEANDEVGGLAATREFAPGFRASVAQTLPQLNRGLVDDLNLEKHGFKLALDAMPTVAMAPGKSPISITSGALSGASAEDSAAYPEYRRLLSKFADAINPFWHKRPPMIADGDMGDLATLGKFGWNLRRLGKDDMRELMRMIALPAQDLMDEFFQDDALKAALSWDCNIGSKLAPRSPNNAVLALLLRMSGDLTDGLPLPAGGAGGFTDALAASATSFGAEIRCGAAVEKVLIDDMSVSGVQLSNGEQVQATTVISNADPKTSFLTLLGAQHLDVQFTHRISRLRNQGYVAKLHLALDEIPTFTGLEKPAGRLMLTPSMKYIECAFDDAKYGGYANELPMEVIIPSLVDDSLAPVGKHVLSANIQYAPYAVKGGWDQHREQFLANALATLSQYSPGIESQVSAAELLTPADLEQQFNLAGGHWHHAEFAIDTWWMNRPTYGASQYTTPISGFHLCGAGAHPGGGLMGTCGANAARAILEDR